VISVAERQAYIGRVRDLAKGACGAWLERNLPSPLGGDDAERSEAGEGEVTRGSTPPHAPTASPRAPPSPAGGEGR
jgi:hypothetical protein